MVNMNLRGILGPQEQARQDRTFEEMYRQRDMKQFPVFQDPTRGPLQDVFDIGRYTIGMENPVGKAMTEELGPETADKIKDAIELIGLGALGVQGLKGGSRGVKKVANNWTVEGKKNIKAANKKAAQERAKKSLLKKFLAKAAARGTIGAGMAAAFPPAAGAVGMGLAGLSVLDLLADKELRGLFIDSLATKEGLAEMESALEREAAQRKAAKERRTGLESLLEARVKP
jgi:hypothetical protein